MYKNITQFGREKKINSSIGYIITFRRKKEIYTSKNSKSIQFAENKKKEEVSI